MNKPLLTTAEALSISKVSMTLYTMQRAHDIAIQYVTDTPIGDDISWYYSTLFATLWEAGRIEGIRQERRRKHK